MGLFSKLFGKKEGQVPAELRPEEPTLAAPKTAEMEHDGHDDMGHEMPKEQAAEAEEPKEE